MGNKIPANRYQQIESLKADFIINFSINFKKNLKIGLPIPFINVLECQCF